jgi:hypothetical protein
MATDMPASFDCLGVLFHRCAFTHQVEHLLVAGFNAEMYELTAAAAQFS